MTKECYQKQRFQAKTLAVIEQANEIIEAYMNAGYKLTLRQLHYQMVVRNWQVNTENAYQRLSTILSNARYAGLVDWAGIEDRARPVHYRHHWTHPGDILKDAASQFTVDKWTGQAYQPEVWIEKEALVGVIESTCARWDVSYFACKGYTSTSCAYDAAQRLNGYSQLYRLPVILYLGDFDPSGEDMSRDLHNRMEVFGVDVEIKRLALNLEQIQHYNPPPQMVKESDARSKKFIEKNGGSCWELDALGPDVIVGLIDNAIRRYIDPEPWNKQVEREREGKALLQHEAQDYFSDLSQKWLI